MATSAGPSLPLRAPARSLERGVLWVLVTLLLAITVSPILWLIATSLKTRAQIIASPPVFLFTPDFSAYARFLSPRNEIVAGRLANSLIVSLGTVVATILISSLAAYAFSRYRFAGRRGLLLLMLATRLLPPVTAIIPLFLLFNTWHLIDTLQGLVIIYTALAVPLATWMMKAFFDGIPVELEEAALVDGASRLRALYSITLPLAGPGMAATSILTVLTAWNDFLFAFIFTSSKARTLPVVLTETMSELGVRWQDMATLAVIIVVPTLLFSVYAQKNLVKGLSAGALK